jgi:hypothetical protein
MSAVNKKNNEINMLVNTNGRQVANRVGHFDLKPD